MRSAIVAVLQADATLTGLLTGGIYDAGVVGEISRVTTPAAFDEHSEVLPCALVKLASEAPDGPFPTASVLGVDLYLYQRAGYGSIDAAVARIFVLLHRQRVGNGVWQVTHAGDLRDLRDEALGCALILSRFQVTRLR